MRVTLIIPPLRLEDSYGGLKKFANPQPSIGVAYIAATVRAAGHAVRIIDAYAGALRNEDIVARLRADPPDVLGVSVLSSSAGVVQDLIPLARRAIPKLTVVLGNLHASLYAEELLRNGVADCIVHGEGEYALPELLSVLAGATGGAGGPNGVARASDALRRIPGLSFLSDGEVVHTASRPLIADLDALPLPAWDLLDWNLYGCDPRSEVLPGAVDRQVLATRGCPNQCTFCSSRMSRSMGGRYRKRSPAAIADEMEFMHNTYGATVFTFIDLAFPLDKAHALAVCAELVRRGFPKWGRWVAECRVKPLDEETVLAMKAAGCARVNLGMESGSDRILALLKKNFTVVDIERACNLFQTADIEVDGMFMLGLPTETEAEIRETMDLALRLPVRYAIFNLFVPYPGCELYDRLMAEGKIHFSDWGDFTSYPGHGGRQPVYCPDTLTPERLMALQREAMRRFYLRPRFILGELRRFRWSKAGHYWSGLIGTLRGR